MKAWQMSKKKSPEQALSCDDINMKVKNNSSKDIEIKSKEDKQLSDDRRILRERSDRLAKKEYKENVEKRQVSDSNKDSDM
jgi:hypothetical protein